MFADWAPGLALFSFVPLSFHFPFLSFFHPYRFVPSYQWRSLFILSLDSRNEITEPQMKLFLCGFLFTIALKMHYAPLIGLV